MPRRRKPPRVVAWRGVAYRATSYDVPLWVGPNRRAGRWNLAYEGTTQYLALDTEATFAEMLRHEDLRTEEEAATYTTTIWQARIEEGSVVDYGTFEKAEAAGFPPEALVDDDYERCQAEAEWLKGHGVRGVLSPSAALPQSVNLTLFGPRYPVGWNSETKLASAIPVQRVTTGSPPVGLVQRVRFFGQPHPLLKEPVRVRRRPREP
jgi:RES domain-containing protein